MAAITRCWNGVGFAGCACSAAVRNDAATTATTATSEHEGKGMTASLILAAEYIVAIVPFSGHRPRGRDETAMGCGRDL
jgi:hypothetical protein